jgi:hypothetical protein
MANLSLLSDGELLERLPVLVRAEREATAEVIEHLVEVERRRLYLEQSCANLVAYCRDRLDYPDDAAYKRARAAPPDRARQRGGAGSGGVRPEHSRITLRSRARAPGLRARRLPVRLCRSLVRCARWDFTKAR